MSTTLRRPIAVKDDLVRMMLRLPNRAAIFLEDDNGNLVTADAELIEDQGTNGPPFLVIKRTAGAPVVTINYNALGMIAVVLGKHLNIDPASLLEIMAAAAIEQAEEIEKKTRR